MSQSDFVSRGQALVAAGQFQEAVKVCRLGLLGRPTTVEGRVVLGQALLALKRYDEVLAEMRVALELDHTAIAAQILKAEALLRKGDVAPAIEALHTARQAAPGDPRILQLLGEAENGPAQRSVAHPAVGFVSAGDARHAGAPIGEEDSGPDGYTKPEAPKPELFTSPTSLQSPGSARRSSQKRSAPAPEPTPPPAVLAVGERTGTVEVDPELEGVEVEDDIDFDDLAAPPRPAARPGPIGGPRGAVISSRMEEPGTTIGKKSAARPRLFEDDDDELELRAPRGPAAPPARNAPSIGELARNPAKSVPPPRSKPPTRDPAPPRAPAAVPPAAPLPPAPPPPVAAPMPPVVAPPSFGGPTSTPFAPTMMQPAAVPAPSPPMAPPPPLPQERLFADASGAPSWGSPMVPPPDPAAFSAANEPTSRPSELDPQILALMSGQPPPPQPNPSVALDPMSGSGSLSGQVSGTPPKGALKTGMRKTRSRLAVVMWVVIGVVVIGGGVFAGFQIRAMRLEKQIVAARQRATDLAKADTWKGWRDARDSLAGIVHASPTIENRAALARTRALIAFEFGDGIVDAKRDVEELAGQGGHDGQIAAAFLALANHDVKAAKAAADAALAAGAEDPAAHYVAGQAALLAGDVTSAVTHMKAAMDKEARPLYTVGYANAQAAAYNWEAAITALDSVFAATPDHPAAVLARASVLAAGGRIYAGGALGNEVRAQLERVVGQGKRPLGEQQHGVSPAQVAFGHVALARVNFLRNDPKAKNELKTALAVNLDDQGFAEEVADTLFLLGDLATARSAADKILKEWPNSRRARITLARILLAQARPADAIEMLTKQADVIALPDALALRGQAHLAARDLERAAADFDAALKKLATHEPALIGRAWVELATGKVDAATKRVAERYSAKGASPALTIVYAATLRRSADAAQRDKAKELLEKLVQTAAGYDLARAQLELARIHRDAGDYRSARPVYSAAAIAGNFDARLEYGLLLIEDRDPTGGRDTLDALLAESGETPSPQLVIETARARMLAGDHAKAQALLELAGKLPGIETWKLDRERGRLALRKSQFDAAATALLQALDKCGSDTETFLLAADVGVYHKEIAEKVKKLAPARLKGRPEAKIIEGKQLIVAEKYAEAEEAYRQAKEALKAEKASPRRMAQADFGLGLVRYIREDFVEALRTFELVMDQDPSLIDTYTFAAEMAKDPRRSLQFAQRAVQYNPEYPYAWLLVGKAAHRARDRKAKAEAIKQLSQLDPTGEELKELRALR